MTKEVVNVYKLGFIARINSRPTNIVDNLLAAVRDIQMNCQHKEFYLLEDVTLEPSKKKNVFLAENDKSLRKSFGCACGRCNQELRFFVGKRCPSCLVEMKEVGGPCEISFFNRCEYLPNFPDLASGEPFFSVQMAKCPLCELTVVWDKFTINYDYMYQK